MISPHVELLGDQTPRVVTAPPATASAGPEAVELAAAAGLVLDPWQRLAVEVILAERPDGRWAAFEAALLVARQDGKGAVLETVELAGLFLFGERLILHSAHEFKTAQEAFLRIKALIDGCDDLRRRVARVRTSHGDEGIELLSGQRLRFMARTRSSGKGFTGDRAVMDEAQELSRASMGAVLPTMAARPNPQVVYAGTVPEAQDDGEHFETLRDRGRRGGDPTLAWLEWSPTPTGPDDSYDSVDLDDPVNWAAANPALGYRITPETIARERASLGADVFAVQRLSIWPGHRVKVTAVVDLDRWEGQAGSEPTRPDPVAFAVTVSPDRRWATVAMAGLRADGHHQVQVVETGRGSLWVPDRLTQIVRDWRPTSVVVNPASPAGSLVADLRRRRIPLHELGARDAAQSCGTLLERIEAGAVFHADQAVLNVAVAHATRKAKGDLWEWVSDDGTDVSPLVAVTYALAGLAVEAPKRSGKVW